MTSNIECHDDMMDHRWFQFSVFAFLAAAASDHEPRKKEGLFERQATDLFGFNSMLFWQDIRYL